MLGKLKTLALLAVMAPVTAPVTATPLNTNQWDLSPKGAEFVEHMGKKAVKLNRGSATLRDTSFKNGVIEFKIAMPKTRGFGGLVFRAREHGMGENFYLRSHQSGNPDANQYQPLFHGNSAWQIYYGPRYSTPTKYETDRWTQVKLVVKDTKMDVYIDSDEPVLHIDKLLHGKSEGAIRLTAAFSDFYFADVTVSADDSVMLRGKPAPLHDMPKGLIPAFQVASKGVASKDVEAKASLRADLLKEQSWQRLDVEENGVANLGRITELQEDGDTLLAKLTIDAADARTVQLKYGFSDRVTVFLNGRAIAHGNDTFRSRDYRYLGTVGLFDSVFLPLEKGENELVFAVSESFGGWAIMAALEDRNGLRVR